MKVICTNCSKPTFSWQCGPLLRQFAGWYEPHCQCPRGRWAHRPWGQRWRPQRVSASASSQRNLWLKHYHWKHEIHEPGLAGHMLLVLTMIAYERATILFNIQYIRFAEIFFFMCRTPLTINMCFFPGLIPAQEMHVELLCSWYTCELDDPNSLSCELNK